MNWLFGAFLLLFLCHARAEDVLETVEVKASKDLSDFYLGSELEIDLSSPSLLFSEALQNLNGVIPSQNGGPGSRITFFIRGTEARHVLYTVDSLRINDPSNVDRQFDSAFILSPFLKDVVVYKGPQAVLYGSDAIGGLIDMRSRKGEEAPEGRLQIRAGSFGTGEASLGQDWKTKSHQGSFTWSQMRTDGISRLNKKRFNAKERDASSSLQLTSSSRHDWTKRWQTDFLTSFLRGNNELDGFNDDNSQDKSRNDQYLLQQKTTHELSSTIGVSLRNGLSRHQRDIKTLSSGRTVYAGELAQSEVLLEIDEKRFHFLGGIASEHESFDQQFLSASTEVYAAFIQVAFFLDKFKFQFGFRGEEHSRYHFFQTGSSGIQYKMEGQIFSLQYSQGYKAPSLYQLFADPIFGAPIGNKNLVPERIHSWEGRYRYEVDDRAWEVVLFQNQLANLITYTPQGYVNQQRFRVAGVEVSADVKNSHWSFRPSATHQEFKEDEGDVLRRPLNQLGLAILYIPHETVELNLKGRHFSARKDVNEAGEVVKLNGFEVIDLAVKINHGNKEYGLQFPNILNRSYEELYGFSVMPRSLFASYGQKF
jgi:vitamin B12 transporter